MTDKLIFEAFLAMGHALQTHNIDPSAVTIRMPLADALTLKTAIEKEFTPHSAPGWAALRLYDEAYKPRTPDEVCKLNGLTVCAEPAK